MMKRGQTKIKSVYLILFLMLIGLACQLTSPTPDTWSGTPTAIARAMTHTASELTQEAGLGDAIIVTPTTVPPVEIERTPTPPAVVAPQGPWLVFLAPERSGLLVFDVIADMIIEISLPGPIIKGDLTRGLSPDGRTLILRAGSAYNTDELALYQVNLPSTEPIKHTPLLSLSLQRQIVNEEGGRAMETLQAVTQTDGLAWSPDGRFLAFTAALDNESSDLYVLDTLNKRIDRINGLISQSASPFWSPNSHWLVSQELGNFHPETGWRSEIVTGIRVPSFDHQNVLYLPDPDSLGEVFLGWINAQHIIAYSMTREGPDTLKQVNVEDQTINIIFDGLFDKVVFDPRSRSLAFALDYEKATPRGMAGGVYLLGPNQTTYSLQRAGDWKDLSWDVGEKFVAAGSMGVYTFNPEGEGLFLANQGGVRLSSQGNWMITYGDGLGSEVGARLHQANSDHPLQTLTEARVETAFWQPDASAFFLQTEGTLYRLAFPSLNLEEVFAGLLTDDPIDLIWVE